jgi:glycosyltransferase involved in cell wall biosynthesis
MGIPTVLDFHFEPAPGTIIGRAAARAYRQLGPRAYPMADVAVVRSYAYGRQSPSLARVPEQRWRIVPNGIDAARFNPDGPREGGDYLLFVGRLVPYKGLEVLLRALAHHPVGMPLRVVGDGPMRRELEMLADRLDVDVEFLGHVTDEALPRLYRGAHLTVLPSVTRQEAFGITLIESMACGTPVVASDLPGVADVARRGGVVSPPRDVNALGRALHAALASDELPMGPPLARAIHQRYSWEAVTRRLVEVYQEVLEAGETPRRAAPDSEVNRRADPGRNPVL